MKRTLIRRVFLVETTETWTITIAAAGVEPPAPAPQAPPAPTPRGAPLEDGETQGDDQNAL